MNEKALISKIDELCPNGPRRKHSYFQIQYFLIGKEPTIQAKIQACKTELLSRRDAIKSYEDSIDDLYDQKRLEEIRLEEMKQKNNLEDLSELMQINIRRVHRKISSINYKINETREEIKAKADESNFLIGLYDKLCNIEEERDWDDLQVQAEYWNARLTQEVESRLLLGQSPNTEDFKTILALPDNMPIKQLTRQLIENGKNKVRTMDSEKNITN